MLDKARIWEGIPGCGLSDGTDGCSRSCALTATFEAALLKARGNGSMYNCQHSALSRRKSQQAVRHQETCLHLFAHLGAATGEWQLLLLVPHH